MCTTGYGDIYPHTSSERVYSMVIMVLGVTLFANSFGTFVVIIDNLNAEQREVSNILVKAMRWAKLRKLDKNSRTRILKFYMFIRTKFNHLRQYNYL
jgi:hypothetical protein